MSVDGLFDRYEQVRELGAGGMARVVLARDRRLERFVALKLLLTGDAALKQRFLHEARMTARCQHANVIVIHEVGYQNACPYIVLEYLRGRSLAALLTTDGRLPYAQALAMMVPVLEALHHIHGVGVVHRDLKPDNVFLTDAGQLKLIDFGIAKFAPGAVSARDDATTSNVAFTRAGMLVGTYQYMSPEQWRGAAIDHLSDIWACGIMLYRMICGRHPLHPLDGQQLLITGFDDPMPATSERAPPEVPRALAAVVDRCLAKRKDQRWPSASALLAALLPWLPPPGVDEPPSRPSDPGIETALFWSPTGTEPGNEPPPPPVPAPEVSRSAAPENNPLLFVAANPGADGDEDTLGPQMNAIRVELERTDGRDRFDLIPCLAPEPLDLLRSLRKHAPTVVYFVGGPPPPGAYVPGQALGGGGGLYFRGPGGKPQFVNSAAIEKTFGAVEASVRLVVLDRCYSEPQARALLSQVDCVVGTTAATGPAAARAYAIGLFGGLGDHQSIAAAHRQGWAAIDLMSQYDATDPPKIKWRDEVDPARIVLAPRLRA